MQWKTTNYFGELKIYSNSICVNQKDYSVKESVNLVIFKQIRIFSLLQHTTLTSPSTLECFSSLCFINGSIQTPPSDLTQPCARWSSYTLNSYTVRHCISLDSAAFGTLRALRKLILFTFRTSNSVFKSRCQVEHFLSLRFYFRILH